MTVEKHVFEELDGDDDRETIPCLVCGKELRCISSHHLRKHGLTTAEYKEEYDTDELMAPAVRAQISKSHRALKSKDKLDEFRPRIPEEILADLKEIVAEQPDLTSAKLKEKHPSLECQLRHAFGSFHNAMREAELRKEKLRRWSKDRVVSEILKRHRKGKSLRPYRVQHEKGAGLVQAARRHCGSWPKALRAAGLDPDEICPKPPRRDRASVAKALRAWVREHGCLISVKLNETDSALLDAAHRQFGGVQKAAAKLNLPYARAQEPNDFEADEVIQELQRLHEEDVPLTVKACNERKPGLCYAAEKFFGSWILALEAAGLGEYASQKRRTPDRLRRDVMQWVAEHGAVTQPELMRSDPALLTCLTRRYGDIYEASKALGFPCRRLNRRWSKSKIIEELKARASNCARENLIPDGSRLDNAIRRHFGSRRAARRAAGLE